METVKENGLVVAVMSWIIGCVIALVSLVYLVLNIKLRNTRLIKMSSPNLNCLVASGGILASITCLLYGVDHFIDKNHQQLSNFCQLRAAFLTCAFTLLYGPLVAKCWRVNRIFEQGSLKRVVIRDSRLYLLIGALLFGDVLMMAAWQIVDPLHYTTVASLTKEPKLWKGNSSINLSVTIIPTCSCNNLPTWLTLMFLLKAPVLITSLVLAWRTRDVLIPSMNDSYSIIISSLTTLFVTATVFTLKTIHFASPDIVTVVILLGIGISTIVTTSMVFVPKLLLWWRNPEKSALRLSINSKSTHNVTGINTADILEDDMFTMVAENISMKKSLQEKDAAINVLQGHLTNAQQKLMEISLDQEARLDSGLDSDGNTTSLEDSPKRGTPSTPPQNTTVSLPETPRQPSLKSFSSSSSVVEYHKLCRLRDSIAEDLTLARDLSSDIRISITKDIHAAEKITRKGSFRYESVKSRQELAGSITKSYNLTNSCDTYDYVSSCVTSSSNLHHPPLKALQYSSSESIDTLPNDKLYPDNHRRKKQKRIPRRNELNKSVYFIPTDPQQVNCAMTKSMDTDTFV
ncbi:hypothetical protein LOTGIDRAFT_165568 [Lottia gigantea]|uniref:G-protein coupled receptors family 3 profile domain-containing protein n=1 Tax=Lottia gigantea TaxID=225164 RepID=V3ZBP4_LOTGI|nr:hypothetical protein LOTGIDRAFT_165568 [Lottia gigantea]ESO88443.1 hypothetical protein LOTGIDRAFT_165568 [Lottia gigantea]